jgi:putative serine/threonine protein kinase
MQHEAEMLKTANSLNVGPRFLDASKNFLLMQFIEGDVFPEWLKKDQTRTEIQKVLREILEQCWRLDKAGLDHGELSHAPRHIIITKESNPFIVDFETASVSRKLSNITSICQFFFFSGLVADTICEKLGERDEDAIVEALRTYKACRSRRNFRKVAEVCGL